MQTPLRPVDDLTVHGASSSGAGASSGGSDYDLAEAERLRKQRDLKRKSRERKKRDLEELQATAAVLEAQYSQLLAAKVKQQHGEQPASPTEPRLIELKDSYMSLRDEVQELRDQMAGFKLKIDEYERFIATLDGQLLLVFQSAGGPMPEQETRAPRPTSSLAASQFQFD